MYVPQFLKLINKRPTIILAKFNSLLSNCNNVVTWLLEWPKFSVFVGSPTILYFRFKIHK